MHASDPKICETPEAPVKPRGPTENSCGRRTVADLGLVGKDSLWCKQFDKSSSTVDSFIKKLICTSQNLGSMVGRTVEIRK